MGTRSGVFACQRAADTMATALDRMILLVGAALLAFVTVALFLQVLYRYVLQNPLSWSEEGARFAMVWLSLLAAANAARSGQHFLFRWAVLKLSPTRRWWLRQTVNLCTLVFILAVLRESMTYLSVVANQTATATGLNMRWAYGGVTAGLALLAVVYSFELVDAAFSIITKRQLSPREANENASEDLLNSSPAADFAIDGDRENG